MEPNGKGGELHQALERIIAAFGWLRRSVEAMSETLMEHGTKLDQLDESSQAASERREREYEALRRILVDIEKAVALLDNQVGEARGDVSDLEKRWTPAQGVPIYNPPPLKNGSGPALAIADKFKLHLPPSWALLLLKFALSVGVGAGLLRA